MSILFRSALGFNFRVGLCLLTTSIAYGANDNGAGRNIQLLIKSTHVYKIVGDVKIAADVYRPEGNEARPVVVWIHGGALIVGSRTQVPETNSGDVHS